VLRFEVANPLHVGCIHTAVSGLPVAVHRTGYAQFPAHIFGLPAAFDLPQRGNDLALGEFSLAHRGFLGAGWPVDLWADLAQGQRAIVKTHVLAF